jgi:prepilin-type N-terminal cleavage/methylation domain-containing protein
MGSRQRQAGFTLIEILIVAALIALLSGIAAINIQRAYVDNQRKATYGELHNVATAVSFAMQDTTIIPKLCFLSQNTLFIAPPDPAYPLDPGLYLLSGFDYYGRTGQYDINQSPSLVNRVVKNWGQGIGAQAYFAAGEGRKGLFQGRRGGLTIMEIPNIYNPMVTPPGKPAQYSWPADAWGRPYVLYILYQYGVDSSGQPIVDFIDRPTRVPNYTLAVVSYGPNGIPGGSANYTAADISIGQQLWLFERADPASGADYRALTPTELTQPDGVLGGGDGISDRVQVWSFEKLGGGDGVYPGIVDIGSDDIVKEF